MKMPNFKPTKWKVIYCFSCKYTDSYTRGYCKNNHPNSLQERDNVPFFIPDMEFSYVGPKWSGLRSKTLDAEFVISSSRLEKLIIGCGIQAGGKIPNKWWMYNKVDSSLSLTWVDDGA